MLLSFYAKLLIEPIVREHQEPLPPTSENSFFVRNLTLAGIAKKDSIQCYIRSECRKLWEFLENPTAWKSIIGCPGVGKSIIVLAYVMHWIQTNAGKSLVYIHSNKTIRNAFTIDTNGNCLKFTFEGKNNNELLEFASSTCYGKYDMAVINGATNDVTKNLLVNRKSEHRLIVCTSFQAITLNGESFFDVCDNYDD